MKTRVRLTTAACVVALAGAAFAEVLLPTAAHAERPATVSEFVLPTDVSGIATGADGNLWIVYQRARTDTGTPTVAKITTAGAVTPYVVHTSSLSYNIMAGPAGRLWWVERNAGTIVSIDPADPVGSVASYPVG